MPGGVPGTCGREMLTPKCSVLPFPPLLPALLVPPPGQLDGGACLPGRYHPVGSSHRLPSGTERPSVHPTLPVDRPLCPEPSLWPVVADSAEQARLVPAGPGPVLPGT